MGFDPERDRGRVVLATAEAQPVARAPRPVRICSSPAAGIQATIGQFACWQAQA
ncbi:hypothetical protein [Planomonospora algeriensis]